MASLLAYLLDGIELIGTYVLIAGEDIINGLSSLITLIGTLAMNALPNMSDAPVVPQTTWLGWLNWFYPVDDLITGLITGAAMWGAFLAVRYTLRLVRAL